MPGASDKQVQQRMPMALQLKLHLAPEVLWCSGEGLEVEVLGEELPRQLRSHIAEQLLREWRKRLPGKLGASTETVCGLTGCIWLARAPPRAAPNPSGPSHLLHCSWS